MMQADDDNPLNYGPPRNHLLGDLDAFNRLALGPLYAPREPNALLVAGVGTSPKPPTSPFDAPPPVGGRNLPTSNYRKPLSEYAPTLYRQADPAELLDYIPGMRTRDKTVDQPYFADHPDMATGQGTNANGVLMAFDPAGIHGQVNSAKPMFEPAWRSGYGEYRASGNDQAAYQDALMALRIPSNLQLSRLDQRQLATAVDRLTSSGWSRQYGPGYTELRRPAP